jgi:hypothetical protein
MQAPVIRVRTNSPIGNDIFFQLPELQGNNQSFLDADVAVGGVTLTTNGSFFSANQYIIIGQPGQLKSEIVKISVASNTALTVGACVFSHNRGDLITFIEYNQIEAKRSTDAGATFTPLSIVDINPQVAETYLQRTGDGTTDVYKFRFYNATSALYSGYSDNVTASGYADNSVYAIKKKALDDMGEKITELITNDFLNNALNEARRIVDQDARVFRWSFRTKFNADIGDIIPGKYSVTAPTDLRDRNTNKNLLNIRIGRQNRQVFYQDQNRFNQNYWNIAHSNLNGAILAGATSIALVSSGNFPASGSIVINAESVSDTKDTASYTGNNLSTNTLTGVTGVGVNHATGGDVWNDANFNIATWYTISNGVIYFNLPFDDQYAGQKIYADYYQALQPVNSDSDLLDEPLWDFYCNYLKYRIKYKKSNGAISAKTDTDYMEFQLGVSALVTSDTIGQSMSFIPTMGRLGGVGGSYFRA